MNPQPLSKPFFNFRGNQTDSPSIGMVSDLEAASELAAAHRYLDCKKYDACLNIAVKQNWRNFTCTHCAEAKGL